MCPIVGVILAVYPFFWLYVVALFSCFSFLVTYFPFLVSIWVFHSFWLCSMSSLPTNTVTKHYIHSRRNVLFPIHFPRSTLPPHMKYVIRVIDWHTQYYIWIVSTLTTLWPFIVSTTYCCSLVNRIALSNQKCMTYDMVSSLYPSPYREMLTKHLIFVSNWIRYTESKSNEACSYYDSNSNRFELDLSI